MPKERALDRVMIPTVPAESGSPRLSTLCQVSNEPPTSPDDDLPEQMRVRRAKRAAMLEQGRDPYPVAVERTHTLREVRAAHPDLPPDTATGDVVGVTGRVIFMRNTGKLCFATLREGDGTELQAMLSLALVGEDELARWKAQVDLGDHVFVHGEVVTSRRGELSVMADSWQMAAKAVRPLPVAHRELSEETRVRQRYVDLIVRPQAREMVRSAGHGRADPAVGAARARRSSRSRRRCCSCSTAGRPRARSSRTANALDTDLYLRIAPELFLKRCVVGGIERVFEINRNFRNEGIDSSHSPEFAMLEAYQAYATYDDMAELTRSWCSPRPAPSSARPSCVTPTARNTIWVVSGVRSRCMTAVSEAVGQSVTPDTSVEDLRKLAIAHDVEVEASRTAARSYWSCSRSSSSTRCMEPTFVRDYPVEVRPLTRRHRDDPRLAEAWDLVVFGTELATAYSELVDPVEQRERLHGTGAAGGRG